MEINTVLWIIRIAVCLAAGFWIARQLRGMIPALVLRLMPAKIRFSEEAFRIQTRISTVLAFALTIGAAALFNDAISWMLQSVTHRTRTYISVEPPAPSPLSTTPDVNTYDQPAGRLMPPEYTGYEATVTEQKKPSQNADVAPAGHYFQISAFEEEVHARRQRQLWSQQLDQPVQVFYVPGDYCPYKVAVGPFTGRAAAKRFGKQHGLLGFPRPAHELLQ